MTEPNYVDGPGEDDVLRNLSEWFQVEDLDDLERALVPVAFEAALDRLDPENKRRRLVLLGAGASAEAGLPTAIGLDEMLAQARLQLYGRLREPFGRDVERIVQVLELLASSSPLSVGLANLGMLQPLEDQGAQTRDVPTHAEREVAEIKLIIRSNFWLPDDEMSAERCAYLRPLLDAQTGGSVATLNYDNVLDRTGHLLDLGAGWPDDEIDVGYQHRFRVRVLPLHGYLGWELRQDPSQQLTKVVRAGSHQNPADVSYPYEPAIVFGASNKLRHFGPFLRLLEAFRQDLQQARTVVTIGYSWRDPHINDMLRTWAARGHEIVQRNVDYIDGPQRWRLVVATGPLSGELPSLANQIRTHYGASIDVRPVRGTSSDVVEQLFGGSGELSQPHIGAYRKFWCGA